MAKKLEVLIKNVQDDLLKGHFDRAIAKFKDIEKKYGKWQFFLGSTIEGQIGTILYMVSLLTKTRRSRSILLASGVVIVFCSVALAIFESPYFLLGLILGLLIYLLAFRIKADDKPVT